MYDETTVQPTFDQPAFDHAAPAAPAAPVPTAPAIDNGPRNRSLIVAAAAAIVLLVILAGLVLTMRGGDVTLTNAKGTPVAAGNAGSTDLGPAATDAPTTVATDAPTTVADAPAKIVTEGKPAGNATKTGGGAQTPKPQGPAPVITSFNAPEKIDCHNGNFQTFTLSWTTNNAVKTTISIDGPGIYKTYGPNDSDSMPFNCSTPHTFMLTAFGANGKTVTKTITLQPRNVQPPAAPDTDVKTDADATPKPPVTKVPTAPTGGATKG